MGEKHSRRPCPHCGYVLHEDERMHVMPKGVSPMLGCACCAVKKTDFGVERNFRKAGTSSRAAHAAAEQARLNNTHRKIWSALKARPMTADEVADECGLVLNTARARMTDLKRAGFIEDTDETRLTAAGKPAAVVRVREKAA